MSKFSPLALIKQQQEENRYRTQVLDLRDIQEHPKNDFPVTEDDISALAESIEKSGGILQFPLVRQLEDGSYQMLAGHRRRKASILLGETVDEKYFRTMCYVLENVSEERAELYLIDTNIQSRELSPKFRAKKVADARRLITTLRDRGEIEIANIKKAVADYTGLSESTVILQTRIAEKLIPELMDMYDQGSFGIREAYDYSGLAKSAQYKILHAYQNNHSEADINTLVSRIIEGERRDKGPSPKEKEAAKKVSQIKKRLLDVTTLKSEGVSLDVELLKSLRDMIDDLLR